MLKINKSAIIFTLNVAILVVAMDCIFGTSYEFVAPFGEPIEARLKLYLRRYIFIDAVLTTPFLWYLHKNRSNPRILITSKDTLHILICCAISFALEIVFFLAKIIFSI